MFKKIHVTFVMFRCKYLSKSQQFIGDKFDETGSVEDWTKSGRLRNRCYTENSVVLSQTIA